MNPKSHGRDGHTVSPPRWKIEEEHFETVYNRYYRQIYGICRRYSSRPDDACDLTHDVFVRYFQSFDRFRHESSPSTWMYRVAVNLGIHRWRKNQTRLQYNLERESMPPDPGDPEAMLLDRITLAKILDCHPERTRKIVLLHFVERMTQIDIGKSLGISRATVIRHLAHFQDSTLRYLKRRRAGWGPQK